MKRKIVDFYYSLAELSQGCIMSWGMMYLVFFVLFPIALKNPATDRAMMIALEPPIILIAGETIFVSGGAAT